MKLISNLSTRVLIIIIKSQEKIKPVKWCFQDFNLKCQNLAESKIPDCYVNFQPMLNLHRVLFCTGMYFDDMHINCLAYYLNRLSLVGYNIWYCVTCK